MNHNTPLSPRPLHHLFDSRPRVLTTRQLREHGISATKAAERSRPGGPWRQLLPGIYLLHSGPPTSQERLHAALLYGGRPVAERGASAERAARPTLSDRPRCPVSGRAEEAGRPYGKAMITGLAALALHRFSSAPSLRSLDRIDVLVPRTRRLRSTSLVRIVRGRTLPQPETVTDVPVAPVARALTDAAAQLSDAVSIRRLLSEAVHDGHCETAVVVEELTRARLLSRPQVAEAVDSLIAEGRTVAEGRLYEMVRTCGLPEPLWNVDLWLPGGPHLGGVDAYWPEQAVALEIDVCPAGRHKEAPASECARKRERLERLGIMVLHITPEKLRQSPQQQAVVVRTALTAAWDLDPAAYVRVLPR